VSGHLPGRPNPIRHRAPTLTVSSTFAFRARSARRKLGFDGAGAEYSPKRRAFFRCIFALQQYYDAMRKKPAIEQTRTLSNLEANMRKGERIRLRPASPGAREWRLPREAEGTVLCHYRVFAGRPGASDRMDVCFSPKTVIWGAPATEFEPIAESPDVSES
jgi:hypothetical protein